MTDLGGPPGADAGQPPRRRCGRRPAEAPPRPGARSNPEPNWPTAGHCAVLFARVEPSVGQAATVCTMAVELQSRSAFCNRSAAIDVRGGRARPSDDTRPPPGGSVKRELTGPLPFITTRLGAPVHRLRVQATKHIRGPRPRGGIPLLPAPDADLSRRCDAHDVERAAGGGIQYWGRQGRVIIGPGGP